MPISVRPHKVGTRLSDAENAVREMLELHLGTDKSGVMRQGLLELGRKHGITIHNAEETLKKKNAPKH